MQKRKNGRWYTDRLVPTVGRINISLGTTDKETALERDLLIVWLRRKGDFELLQALKDGRLTIEALQRADEAGQLAKLRRQFRDDSEDIG